MKLAICITTRNREIELEKCLDAIWSSSYRPHEVIVSDDSLDDQVISENIKITQKYPGTVYVSGPKNGVCGNRNNAVAHAKDSDFVSFVDDDIYVEKDFIERSTDFYQTLTEGERSKTIISGISLDQNGDIMHPSKLSFRGYFQGELKNDHYETVVIHAAIFPISLFRDERWDENIFFGYEDGELCLRAIKRGYLIKKVSGLQVFNSCYEQGTLNDSSLAGLSNYQIYTEAARLYVGVKRYKFIDPNFVSLFTFVSTYFIYLLFFLIKNRSLQVFPELMKRSQVDKLWKPLPQF